MTPFLNFKASLFSLAYIKEIIPPELKILGVFPLVPSLEVNWTSMCVCELLSSTKLDVCPSICELRDFRLPS